MTLQPMIIGSSAMRMNNPELTYPYTPYHTCHNIDIIGHNIDIIATFDHIQTHAHRATNVVESIPIDKKHWKLVIKNRDGKNTIYKYEIAWPGSTGFDLIRLVQDLRHLAEISYTKSFHRYEDYVIANNDILLTLKLSHKYLRNSPHFVKTREDIFLLKEKGAKIPTSLIPWLKRREEETYRYAHSNLKQSKKNFFCDDGLTKYVYNHDDIHQAISTALGASRPAYELYKIPGEEIQCSKTLFFEACDEDDRLRGVLEESLVLALERSQIPYPTASPLQSFTTALQKVCTSITLNKQAKYYNGWFREFAWEHYDTVRDMYPERYVENFFRSVADGKVKKYYSNTAVYF